MLVRPIPINWHPELSIYASEPFLASVSSRYGWLGGFDEAGKLQCVLPYTIVHKPFLRMVRFRVETIPISDPFDIVQERSFLDSAMEHFRSVGADLVIPATTNTIFRTFPDGAIAVPYGSYVVDLRQPEETLWNNVHSKHRNSIRRAKKSGVAICEGMEYLPIAHRLIRETLRRSKLSFLRLHVFERAMAALGEQVKVFVATHDGQVKGCAVTPFSSHSAYYLYGGSDAEQFPGAMHLLQWEVMLRFRALGVARYDFVGVRIQPEEGSKQDGLRMFKERFGGRLVKGYMWKCPLRPLKYHLYNVAARFRSGGDIVDQEVCRLDRAPVDRTA
jgi:hypothetical protein